MQTSLAHVLCMVLSTIIHPRSSWDRAEMSFWFAGDFLPLGMSWTPFQKIPGVCCRQAAGSTRNFPALNRLQGLWKGVLPSLVMVCNPTVNFMLYETLRSRLEDWRMSLAGMRNSGLLYIKISCICSLPGLSGA